MARRCPGARLLGSAVLSGHRWLINRQGVATVVPDAKSDVHGLLWSCTEGDLAALDRYEGVATGWYTRQAVMVRSETVPVEALIYVATDATPGKPRPGYLESVVRAARKAGLPAGYVAELERHGVMS
jgi:gamma-glutamylcyclotransferase (GGCT)/AIG2-like uncharacterized protein YtfP